MTLWAGLLRRAASGRGAQSREEERGGGTPLCVQPAQPRGPWVPVTPSSGLPVAPDGAWGGRDLGWTGITAGRASGWTAQAVPAPGADEGAGGPSHSRASPWPSELLEGSHAHRRGLGGAGPDACDGDAQSSASQDAGLALGHRLLPAVHLYADAKSCFLALRGGSADTFAALGWKKKRERLNGTWWR